MESWRKLLLIFITLFAAGLAIAVIIGWITHLHFLASPDPSLSPMRVPTALLALLCSVSLLCLVFNLTKLSLFFSIPLFVLSTIFSLESFFSIDLGFSRIFTFEIGSETSLRPTKNTSLSFFLLALALFCLCWKKAYSWLIWIAGLIGAVAFAVSLTNFYSYLGGFETIYSDDVTRMTFYSTVILALLSFASIALAHFYIYTYPDQLKYFSSIIVFIIATSIAFALYDASRRKITNNILDLLKIEVINISVLTNENLKESYNENIRFRDRLIQSNTLDNTLIKIDAKNYLKDISGLEAIIFYDDNGKIQHSFFDKKFSEKDKKEFTDIPLLEKPFEPIFYVKETDRGINKLIFEAPADLSNKKQSYFRFIYEPTIFFQIPLINPTKMQIKVNDRLMYKNGYTVSQRFASSSYSSRFQNLEIESSACIDDTLLNKITGPIPKIGLFLGLIFAIFSGYLVYILQRFQVLLTDLKTSNNAKTAFLSNVGHEIRTPLHGVIGTGSLLETTLLDPKQKRFLKILMISARHLLNLVNNLLDMTKLESGALPIFIEPSDLRTLCKNQIDILKNQLQEKSIELKLNYVQEKQGLINVAITPLTQIIVNLIGNAIKFTNEGSVTLDVLVKAIKDDSGEIQLNVIDTGIGIPDDKKHLVFEKFGQIDEQQSIKAGGTGLGLFLTKSLVEKMDGKIWFESTKGRGSSFHVVLPITFKMRENENE